MLTDKQQYAFDKFKKLKVGALFMKQGTGKTRVAIELIKTTDSDLVLFFTPCSTKDNLQQELIKWQLDREYIIMGYETLSNSDKAYIGLLKAVEGKKLFIVADESIFIKNDDTKRYKRLMSIAKESEYKLILNGTPLTKNEWDIYNQMNFLSYKIIDMSKQEFLNVFFKKISFKKAGQRPREFYKLSDVNIDFLHHLIAPYIYECDFNFDKDESTQYIRIIASNDNREVYSVKKQALLNSLGKGESIIEQFQNLALSCFKDEKRYKEIAEHIKTKEQIIVFCTLVEEAESIASELNCYLIAGATPLKERAAILDKFKNDNKALVMTLGTGAYGLNLQFCNKVAFASITFDYSKTEQAISRIKRIGQENDIEYIYFTSDLGIFNMILENNEKKRDLKELLIDKIEQGGNYFEKVL
jgi:complete genome|nr:MAG TPA: Chromatin remodeling complex ATPase [Caudoviricetes sp.]